MNTVLISAMLPLLFAPALNLFSQGSTEPVTAVSTGIEKDVQAEKGVQALILFDILSDTGKTLENIKSEILNDKEDIFAVSNLTARKISSLTTLIERREIPVHTPPSSEAPSYYLPGEKAMELTEEALKRLEALKVEPGKIEEFTELAEEFDYLRLEIFFSYSNDTLFYSQGLQNLAETLLNWSVLDLALSEYYEKNGKYPKHLKDLPVSEELKKNASEDGIFTIKLPWHKPKKIKDYKTVKMNAEAMAAVADAANKNGASITLDMQSGFAEALKDRFLKIPSWRETDVIEINSAKYDKNISKAVKDTGKWLYFSNPDSVHYGKLFLDCDHKDKSLDGDMRELYKTGEKK